MPNSESRASGSTRNRYDGCTVTTTRVDGRSSLCGSISVPRLARIGNTRPRILGRVLPILANRGTLIEPHNELLPSTRVVVTVHPSYLLRVLPEARDSEFGKFVEDLKIAAKYLRGLR